MVYDAGHWTGQRCRDAVVEVVAGDAIDLLVLSHPDSDHLGQVDDILAAFEVRQIIRTGFERPDVATWRDATDAIAEETREGASVLNLKTFALVPGTTFSLGETILTLVAGWHTWPDPGLSDAELRNVISIVVRLEYRGRAVLFTGDTVGRRLDDPDTACKDAELVMVERAASVPIRSDVLIAPHHGANNASARSFIEAVDPQFVIFPAGHAHAHPRQAAADRYLAHDLDLAHMFRTDRGDDDVEILLKSDGSVDVEYRQPGTGC